MSMFGSFFLFVCIKVFLRQGDQKSMTSFGFSI